MTTVLVSGVVWEWLETYSFTKQIGVQKTKPQTGGAWGPDVVTQQLKPEGTVSIKADIFDWDEAQALITLLGTPNTFTFTMTSGNTFTGVVTTAQMTREKGMQYFSVTATVRRTDLPNTF